MRDIVHLNIAHFAATVEQAAQPALRRCPIIVSLQSRGRSFVYDVSAEAWLNGVDRGISLSAARRRLPKAVVVPARPAIYRRAAQSLYRLAGEFSPLVEPAPRGHLFLDITGMYSLYGASVDLAARLKRECRSRLGLDPGIGLASSKLVSKVATRVVKPFGFASVPGGSETGFLGPQPVTLLPGVGDALSHRMTALGIVTLGDLSLLPDDLAMAAFGRPGMRFRDFARGIDGTPVTGRGMHELPVKVIKEFASDSSDLEELEIHLHGLIEEAGFRLRQRNLTACRVRLFLGYTDSVSVARQTTLRDGENADSELFQVARSLLRQTFSRRVRVRKLGLKLSRLNVSTRQLELFTPPRNAKIDSLQWAVDKIKRRFGMRSIVPAFTLAAPPAAYLS